MSSFFIEIYNGLLSLSLLEGLAVFFSFTSTIFLARNKVFVFPFTIIGSLLYIYLFYSAGIYADIFVSLYFIITSLMGWYHWRKGLWTENPPDIMQANFKELVQVFFIFILFFVLLALFLHYFTDSNIVVWDALSTALAFSATILMINRKIENWIIWILAVVVSIPICFYKHLYLTSIFYVFTLMINLVGWYKWNRLMKSSRH